MRLTGKTTLNPRPRVDPRPPNPRAAAEAVNDRAKLMMHRLVARRVRKDPDMVDRVRERLSMSSGVSAAHVREWQEILDLGAVGVARKLVERSKRMDRLRLSSPFMELFDFTELSLRRRIWRKARPTGS